MTTDLIYVKINVEIGPEFLTLTINILAYWKR